MILLIRNLACSPCGLNNLSNTKAYPLHYNSYCPLINQINCLQEPEIIQQNNTQYHTNLVICVATFFTTAKNEAHSWTV